MTDSTPIPVRVHRMQQHWHTQHFFMATVTATSGNLVQVQKDGEDLHPQYWPRDASYSSPTVGDRVWAVDFGSDTRASYLVIDKILT